MVLMVLPNVFQLKKLIQNVRHPIHDWAHTRHRQYPVGGGQYLVEHYWFGRLVTVDTVVMDKFAKGFFGRLRQLFGSDFYYGHCEYFPQPFRLVERKYIRQKKGDRSTRR